MSLLNENYYDDVFILCHTQKNKETPQSFQDDLNKVKETSKTGECFDSIKTASIKMEIDMGNLSRHLKGFRKTVSGYTFSVLK